MMPEMHSGRGRIGPHPYVRALIAVALAGSGFTIVSRTTASAQLTAPAAFDLEEMTIADVQARTGGSIPGTGRWQAFRVSTP